MCQEDQCLRGPYAFMMYPQGVQLRGEPGRGCQCPRRQQRDLQGVRKAQANCQTRVEEWVA